jgi:hypothetical protein
MSDNLASLGWKLSAQTLSQVFGTIYTQYRPTGALLPLSATPLTTTLPGYFAPKASDMKPGAIPAPFDPAKPRCVAAVDPAALALGDYVVGPFMAGGASETLYVASIQAPSPPGFVRCNAMVDFTRGIESTIVGAQPSLDMQAGQETVIAQGWPISVLREGRGERGDTGLPSDVKLGGFMCLAPASIPTDLRSGDTLTVTNWLNNPNNPGGIRLIVAMAECTPDGWKLLAQEAMT